MRIFSFVLQRFAEYIVRSMRHFVQTQPFHHSCEVTRYGVLSNMWCGHRVGIWLRSYENEKSSLTSTFYWLDCYFEILITSDSNSIWWDIGGKCRVNTIKQVDIRNILQITSQEPRWGCIVFLQKAVFNCRSRVSTLIRCVDTTQRTRFHLWTKDQIRRRYVLKLIWMVRNLKRDYSITNKEWSS